MSETHPQRIVLSYFDYHGGRGEPARLALSIAGIPFVDHRIARDEWKALKPEMPFGQLPVLDVDGKRISQSNSINRYVGRLAGLYPDDPWEAAKCDEICDAVESLAGEMLHAYKLDDDDERRRERERLVAGPIPLYLGAFAARLQAAGSLWFADGRLTMADLKVAELVRSLGTGRLDHIPQDIVARVAPTLVDLRQRVLEHPGVRAYYERMGV